MLRFIVLGVLFTLFIVLAHWLCSKISYSAETSSFLLGLGVATLTGFAWMLIGNWWTAVHRPFEPMRVVLQTQQTPAQVNWGMSQAIVQGILVLAILIAAVILIIANW